MAVRPSGPEESMLAYSTAEELFCVKLGRSGRPERPHWRGRLAVSGAGAEQPSLPTALAVLDGSRGRLAVGSCGGGLSVCELTPQEPESVQDGPARHSTFWQAGRVPVTELHYLAAAGRLASLHSGMLTGAHVFLQEAGSLMLWDLDTQHCLLQAQDVLDGFRLVASVPVDEGGNELLAASYKLSDSQMLRGQCQLCPLETPTSLCFHKARISSAALCAFDARAPAGGMVQRFSTGHRSIYPRLQLVRQHFLVTSHAGTPVALWDRRHMNGPVHEVQHLPTHLDPPPPTPLPPCEDLPFNQGLHLHATQDLLVGRADNGMIWLWDLSERLGWADGSHPGTWLREATSAAAACAAEGTAAAHSDTAPGEHSLGAGQSDGQQHALGFQRQSLQSLHADERDYDRSPLPLGCLWPPEPVPCMGPQGDAQWVPLPELWVGHCWLAGLGCGEVCTEEEGPEGLPLFDGLTLLHEFSLDGSKVSYRNRYQYPKLEKYIAKVGRLPVSFGGDPCKTLFGAAMSRLRSLGAGRPGEANVGVTIGRIQGNRQVLIIFKLVNKSDFNGLVEVDPKTLQSKPMFTYTDINPAFKGFLSAAHGQYDAHQRCYYNFTMDMPRGAPTYNIFCIPDDDPKGYLLAKLQADPAYVHSFTMTEHYIVFMVWPAIFSMLRLALGGGVAPSLTWRAEKGTMMYVIDRRKGGPGHVATYKAPAFFCFHTINSYEEGDALHIDLCGYDDMTLIDDFYMSKLRSEKPAAAQGTIRRYTLPNLPATVAAGPTAVQAAQVSVLCDGRGKGAELFDLPRMDTRLYMRRYKYVYCVTKTSQDSHFFDGLAKVDVSSGKMVPWQQEGFFPGEPIFLPRPGSSTEDDGVLLSIVLQGDAEQPRSFLLLLDAGSMSELGRATIPPGLLVPFGFHGNFFPSGDAAPGSQLD
ncbi:hypothetical protein N2152v2_001164 [Parachlorella kessleri]